MAALAENFTDTQLHALMLTAEHPDQRELPHWKRLRNAAIAATDCADCYATRH